MKDTERGVVLAELRAVGIKPISVEVTGRSHYRIRWRATPDKEVREIFVAATPGDWRSRLNTRAQVRRLLRADNVSLPEQVRRAPQSQLAKALAVPTETPSLIDEVRAMRAELAELTELAQLLLSERAGEARHEVA
jgi:hypothetical protein